MVFFLNFRKIFVYVSTCRRSLEVSLSSMTAFIYAILTFVVGIVNILRWERISSVFVRLPAERGCSSTSSWFTLMLEFNENPGL